MPIVSFAVPLTGLDPWYAMTPTFSTAGLPHIRLPSSR
jgi:hypothetical protein